MNLFFAYVLAVCPALNDVICVLAMICGGLGLLCIITLANEPEGSEYYHNAKTTFAFLVKAFLVLALLWALVPSQARLNSMMLNHHAGCVDVRDEYGVQK